MSVCVVCDGKFIEFLDDGITGEVDGVDCRFYVGHVVHFCFVGVV